MAERLDTMGGFLAAGLLAVACVAGCGKPSGEAGAKAEPAGAGSAQTREFAIDGMVCEGCVQTITTALKDVPGVQKVEVSLENKKATVVADPEEVPSSKIVEVVHNAGESYSARPLAPAGEGKP